LAAVLGIVRGHRGTLKAASTPGRGTVFQVLLPCYTAVPEAGLDSGPEGSLRGGHGTVLVVEDEPSIRTFTRRALESVGFQVREAGDGREGLDLYDQHSHEIVAVLLDLTMPHMDGTEVLAELRRLRLDLPVMVMSGYSEMELSMRFAGIGASGFIQKPFRPRDLIARLCQLLPSQGTVGCQ
jgi:CheY-like chemotaxis protein